MLLISYVLFTVFAVAGTLYARFLVRRVQAGAVADRERLEAQDKILKTQTFPALEAAGQAVESSQNLIFAIQQSLTGKGRL